MSLLQEIMRHNRDAADVLKRAKLNTVKDLRSLTRQDLQELFPGIENFKLRRDIFDIVHKQKPVEWVLRELKEFIPDQSFRDALTNNGVLVDYLQILKDMKSHMNSVQSFLDAHISLLEEFSTNPPDQKSTRNNLPDQKSTFYDLVKPQPAGRPVIAPDTSDSRDQMVNPTGGHPQGEQGPIDINDQTDVCEQEQQGSSPGTGSLDNHGPTVALASQSANHPQQPHTTLVYKALVAGKTFGAHVQLMEKVKEQVPYPFQFIERNEDYQMTFVFCPISSCIASDVEAALADVKGDEPVILVLMHHVCEVKCTPAMRTWNDDSRVWFHVNVFYHETQHGLLKCEQNNAAASEIRNKLLERFFGIGNVQAVGAESDSTGNTSGRDGRNTSHSDYYISEVMTLLQEIMHRDRDAADVLKRAKLNTDKDLRSLTRQDLQELIPGAENFKLRRDIFDIIHKQQPVERVLREMKEFIPDQSFRDALTNNGVLLDYLQILRDMKLHMNSVQSFLDAHIGLLEEFSPNLPDQKSTHNDLPDQKSTRNDLPDQKSTCYDPPDQKSTRNDLPDQKSTRNDLPDQKSTRNDLPDQKSTGYNLVKPQPAGCPVIAPDTSDSRDQMVNLTGGHPQGEQGPTDSFNDQTDVCEQGQQGSSSGTGSLDNHGPTAALPSQSANHPQHPQSEPFTVLSQQDFAETTLVYQALVAGKTFDADLQLMEKVKEQVPRPIQFIERNEDYQITFVFCPISSRIAADVEAALADVKGNKPVILVLMHHTREAKYTPAMRTWKDDSRVLFHVNVFYHETQRGLLKCEQNNAAASEIRHKLLEHFFGSGNVQAMGADSDSTEGRDGRNTKRSDSDRSSSGPNRWLRNPFK